MNPEEKTLLFYCTLNEMCNKPNNRFSRPPPTRGGQRKRLKTLSEKKLLSGFVLFIDIEKHRTLIFDLL